MKIDSKVVDMALNIAKNKVNFTEFVQWLDSRTSRITE